MPVAGIKKNRAEQGDDFPGEEIHGRFPSGGVFSSIQILFPRHIKPSSVRIAGS